MGLPRWLGLGSVFAFRLQALADSQKCGKCLRSFPAARPDGIFGNRNFPFGVIIKGPIKLQAYGSHSKTNLEFRPSWATSKWSFSPKRLPFWSAGFGS